MNKTKNANNNLNLGRVGLTARFKPLHLGGAAMLEALCKNSDHVIIGLGSSNKYNVRNPFTADESEGMVHAFLKSRFNNYEVIHIPDFAHIPEYSDGQKWREYVKDKMGDLDFFVTGNAYVANLLKDDYSIIKPNEVISSEKRIQLRATMVRYGMAKDEHWEKFVPRETELYLKKHHLVERFQKEFGVETIESLKGVDYSSLESAQEEMNHTKEK